jgi:antirestriction protein ArdC
VPVLTWRIRGGVQGYYEPSSGTIALRPGLDSHSRLLVLFHEWAHGLLHPTGTEDSRAQREWQAEVTSCVVAQHYGVEHPLAAEYLTSCRAMPL